MKKSGKRKSRKNKTGVGPGPERAKDAPVSFGVQSENKTDYGGLPELDLKKNLGCG